MKRAKQRFERLPYSEAMFLMESARHANARASFGAFVREQALKPTKKPKNKHRHHRRQLAREKRI